ncbi:MAG: SUMF1/EgtB/PvdO family nonheme iron enzyme [Piscinibacter sp.]|nr:SUMF1/EgtB/PvdO family nonheme iron enzyme [Piscinibacter sp.]
MHEASLAGEAARRADARWLAQALQSSRADTLATFAAYEAALPGLAVPRRETLNPPLWELGHIGWFQEYWIARNPERARGAAADPEVPRRAGLRPDADALYDSGKVAHATRWALPLPDARATRADLQAQLETTLALLEHAGEDDAALYFFRLALLHEDMHHEAALYMARALGVPVVDPRWQASPLPAPGHELAFDPAAWTLGADGPGFVFDNERAAHRVDLPATRIDRQVLRWAEYLPFVQAGGYGRPHWWSAAGWEWLAGNAPAASRWDGLDPAGPACHLSAFEAEAWCRWAGRRLPSEAEWERAALERPAEFAWGQVWEWTASSFAPYPGFAPHPYRDYSAPWFGSRRVLRGASHLTQPRLHHPRYRNFFPPHRHDIAAGFRSCAL